jgi:hypothetical protein
MRFFPALAAGLLTAGLLAPSFAQAPPAKDAPATEAPASESKGMPPRATPGDYQAHAQAGTVTIAAEFAGHGIPTPEQALSTEDYVAVEVGLFGPPDARLTISRSDFSIRIAGKKAPLPSEPYELVFQSLKDPEWAPPEPAEPKSKGSGITTGGGGGQGGENLPPAPVHMPFELVRAMQLHVQRAVLPIGDRPLPQAGLLFFRYHGKTQGIRSLELVYSGPAGSATIPLQP